MGETSWRRRQLTGHSSGTPVRNLGDRGVRNRSPNYNDIQFDFLKTVCHLLINRSWQAVSISRPPSLKWLLIVQFFGVEGEGASGVYDQKIRMENFRKYRWKSLSSWIICQSWRIKRVPNWNFKNFEISDFGLGSKFIGLLVFKHF